MRFLPAIVWMFLQAQHHGHSGLLHYFMHLGPTGLLLISTIDSSPIPLPIPGSSDLLVVVYAAKQHSWWLATLIATLGSALGSISSYQLGHVGGERLMDKYAPKRIGDRLKQWSCDHPMLSVALPAVLPPPAPLMPFLIAAGALRMPRREFYPVFIVSRFLRHGFYAWLGIHYGRHIVPVYNEITKKYGWILLIVIWGSVAFAIAYATYKLIHAKRQGGEATAAA